MEFFYTDHSFSYIITFLFYLILIVFIPFVIYHFLDDFGCVWCFYLKIFKFLGIFPFLEKNFNQTVNRHKYFIISIFYAEKQKELAKKNKTLEINQKDL
ncbi:hypothetical protein AshY1_04420 [Candidatus Phytoplasma fraxini]|uniref:Uncharacterized protein n=1 Tax=Ash yellows phytoplasma TaxID=35780 RepID=A0ABZ2UDT7_ASHYP